MLQCCLQFKTDDLEKLEGMDSLESQVKASDVQDKHGKQNFHEDMKKLYEPITDTSINTFENLTKTTTESSRMNTKANSDLNEKIKNWWMKVW